MTDAVTVTIISIHVNLECANHTRQGQGLARMIPSACESLQNLPTPIPSWLQQARSSTSAISDRLVPFASCATLPHVQKKKKKKKTCCFSVIMGLHIFYLNGSIGVGDKNSRKHPRILCIPRSMCIGTCLTTCIHNFFFSFFPQNCRRRFKNHQNHVLKNTCARVSNSNAKG